MRLTLFSEDQRMLAEAGWVDVLPKAGEREGLNIPVITRREQRNGWRIAEVIPNPDAPMLAPGQRVKFPKSLGDGYHEGVVVAVRGNRVDVESEGRMMHPRIEAVRPC